MAAGGVPILPYFERYPELVALLSEMALYIRDWVRVFYATLFISPERTYIQFMFKGGQCWDLNFLDAQTGNMNSMKMAMKVRTEFSSNSQENSTLYTVERGGYLYP